MMNYKITAINPTYRNWPKVPHVPNETSCKLFCCKNEYLHNIEHFTKGIITNNMFFKLQPRQNGGRYSRVPSQGGSMGGQTNVFSPEYDDPANCAPEEDQYGSQYGQYGAPYDHYGSRGSVGRRSVGSIRNLPMSNSPEPPPPPPRNHD